MGVEQQSQDFVSARIDYLHFLPFRVTFMKLLKFSLPFLHFILHFYIEVDGMFMDLGVLVLS